ncbi:MAG: hypothetical protein QF441_08525 [Bacteriovoracaceae bacterium]|jgi:hypothetical protein|nr:hypothetical protein [Bacteriovoracaceae bacterium]
MSKKLLFLVILLSSYTYGLESTDVLSTQILKIYRKNILVLDRGLEDAIFKNDHIKITSNDGFIARGICVKATLLTSHWKIYRVVRPHLVSKDKQYTMHSINQSEMPPSLKKYTKVDFTKYFNDINDEKLKKQLKLQQERIAKYDLPEKTSATTAFQQEKQTQKENKFLKENFDSNKLKKDLSQTYLSLFASPISWQTRYDQKENHYGGSLFNTGSKYLYELNTLQTQRKILDPVTKEGYHSQSSFYEGFFQLNKLNTYISLYSHLSYRQEKIGEIYYPYSHREIAPLGLKIHLWEKDPKNNFLELSYAPSFDSISMTNAADIDGDLITREGIRHKFQIKYSKDLSKNTHNLTEILYAPFRQLNVGNFQFEDTLIKLSTTFSYLLGNQFFWDYRLEFINDELRAEIYNIEPNNTIQSLRLRYEFDL